MYTISREIIDKIRRILGSRKSVLLLGPRQTGKTTILGELPFDLSITFADPRTRLRYEKNPGRLIQDVQGIICENNPPRISVDEVQKVPEILDAVQYLIDENQGQFILTGSSARKLKRDGDVNLLPGRVISVRLDALMVSEIPSERLKIKDLLIQGSLPEIVLLDDMQLREELLETYVTTYLEEEIRSEALVRNLASFARFLELAASESGNIVNMNKLSQVIGVANTTIDSYYQILDDCLVVEKIEPITFSKTRHRLSKSQRYVFYDLGVRRVAAREGVKPPSEYLGRLFEQFVGMELIKLSRLQPQRSRLRYWKDLNGAEVDWVIEQNEQFLPIEVKWTDAPTIGDAKHLSVFLKEYDNAKIGYIICRTPNRMKITDNVFAINWRDLSECFDKLIEYGD